MSPEATIVWAIAIIALALVLFFLEVLLPSGGLLGVLAVRHESLIDSYGEYVTMRRL